MQIIVEAQDFFKGKINDLNNCPVCQSLVRHGHTQPTVWTQKIKFNGKTYTPDKYLSNWINLMSQGKIATISPLKITFNDKNMTASYKYIRKKKE